MLRWVSNHRAVARREAQELARDAGTPEQAISAALGLVALYGSLHGWPGPEDPVSLREDREMWERFARLRRHYGLPR
jgi:hypothetical protein